MYRTAGPYIVAQRDRHRRIESTAAIGGTADMNGRVASVNSVEFGPEGDMPRTRSFDHLVGAREQRAARRGRRPGGLEVDHQLEFGRLCAPVKFLRNVMAVTVG